MRLSAGFSLPTAYALLLLKIIIFTFSSKKIVQSYCQKRKSNPPAGRQERQTAIMQHTMGLNDHRRCDSDSYQVKERDSEGRPPTTYVLLPLSTIVATLRDQSVLHNSCHSSPSQMLTSFYAFLSIHVILLKRYNALIAFEPKQD